MQKFRGSLRLKKELSERNMGNIGESITFFLENSFFAITLCFFSRVIYTFCIFGIKTVNSALLR